MDLLIENGDYVPDGLGGFVVATGIDAMVQRVLYRLTVPLGSFLPQPEFGSMMPYLCREKPSQWEALARQYVRVAIEEEEGVTLEDLTLSPLEDGKVEMEIFLGQSGETVSFIATVG